MAEQPKKKAFWKSKTFWFNVVSLAIWGASMASSAHPEAAAVKEVAPYVIGGGNILLRMITKGAVGLKDN